MFRKILLTLSVIILSVTLIYPQQDKSPNHPGKKNPSGERDYWELQLSFNLNTVTGAAGNTGAEFDGTYIYTTRWASNLIHKIDINGNLIEEFSIPGVSGLRDLAFDGTYMYGGAAGNIIYQMDFNTHTLIGTISSPVPVRFIAYDEVNDGFWCGSWSDNPTLVSRSGTMLASFSTGLSSQYGAAYDNVNPGGPFLWMFDQGGGACPGSLMIIQYDIASGTATGIAHDACADLTDGIAGGLFSTSNFTPGYFQIGGVMQSNSGLDDTFFLYIGGWPVSCFVGSSNPNVVNGADEVSVNLAQLNWTNYANYGDSIISNKLYFGTDPANLALVQSGTVATSWNISPSPLNYYTIYYWKVLEICNTGYCIDCPTRYFITEQDSNLVSVTENFHPQNDDYWTGTTDGTNKTDVSEVRGHNTEDGWFMFDISSIPSIATIDSARFYGYVNYTYYPFWSATPLPGLNPLTALASELETAIANNSGISLAYIYSNESSAFSAGWHNYLMGNTANADLQAALSQGWFAMGMDSRDNSTTYYINWDGWAQTNIPYLKVTYQYSVPVELTAFRADVNNRDVVLNWQTATELNNRGFEIERKVCNKQYEAGSEESWNKVEFVAGNGTTTKPKSYSFTDRNLSPGKYSYRLKQIDFDGSFEYSKNIEVEVAEPLKFSLDQNYPNPFNPTTKIKYSIPEDGNVSLKIYNILGQQTTELVNGYIKAGNYEAAFNSQGVASGVYFYKIEWNSKVLIRKMLLLK